MAFSFFKVLKGVLIKNDSDESKTLTLSVSNSATTSTDTTIQASQTASRTLTLPDATTTLVGHDATQTLSNKSLVDTTTAIVDSGDATKKILFDAGGTTATTTTIAAAQTSSRTLTLPDLTDTLISRTSTDTGANRLQNKELSDDSVVFVDQADTTKKLAFQASGITTGTTRTLTAPDASTTIVGHDTTQTLTNKSLSDTTTAIVDVSDATKKILFDAGGTTGTTTTITGAQTASRVLTLPDITDTLVSRTSSDTGSNRLQNKELSDDSVLFVDQADTTKKVAFQVSGVTTGTTRTLTVPNANVTLNLGTDISSGAATNGQVLTANGSGASTWTTLAANLDESKTYLNGSLSVSTNGTNITIALKDKSGSDPSSSSPVKISFRDRSSATGGTYTLQSVTSALSMTLGGTETLGLANSVSNGIYVYLYYDGTNPVALAVSGHGFWDEGEIQATTAGNTSNQNLINDGATAVSNIAIRLIGKIMATNTGSAWTTVSKVTNIPFMVQNIVARYKTSAGQTVADVTDVRIDYGTKEYDSHNSVTTGASWVFTAPVAGKYNISAAAAIVAGTGWNAGESAELSLEKNGSVYSILDTQVAQATHTNLVALNGDDIMDLAAGETASIRIRQASGASTTLNVNNQRTYIAIARVGD